MRLTEQYLKRLITQTMKEVVGPTKPFRDAYDRSQAEADEQNDLEGQQQDMTVKMQGNEAKLKHKNVKRGLEELHRLLQSGRPDIQEMATIVERLLRGIESGVLPLK